MIDKVYIVSNRGESENMPSGIFDFSKTLDELGFKKEIVISSAFKGDLLHEEQLESIRSVASKTWKESPSN